MPKKLIAVIVGFILIGLAGIFGTSFSPDKLRLWVTGVTVTVFVAGTAFFLGIIFGKALVRFVNFAGCISLLVMWLPLQIYSTDRSLYVGFGFFMLNIFVVFLLGKVGARLNPTISSACAKVFA
jgi:hypothetical protein